MITSRSWCDAASSLRSALHFVGNPIVARKAARMIFTQQTFTEYPNYWLSDTRFAAPRQVTDADPDLLKKLAHLCRIPLGRPTICAGQPEAPRLIPCRDSYIKRWSSMN